MLKLFIIVAQVLALVMLLKSPFVKEVAWDSRYWCELDIKGWLFS
jgi:hypothetical protein